MSILEIATTPAPVLRAKADKVRAFNSQLRQLVEDMVDTMRNAPGVGLAAPQVGIGQRVIVVEFAEPPEDPEQPAPEPKLHRVVNPEIIRRSPEQLLGNEGCLSIPGFMGEVERSQSVLVRGFTPDGVPLQIQAEGWLARIFQHEVDHLDGVLFTDRAERVWKVEPEEAEASTSRV